jgi:hypothetical protein
MITNKQFLEECPGWSYRIDILSERLHSLLPKEIKVDNLIEISVVRDKQHYTDYGIKLNIPNEHISPITNSGGHLNLHLKLETEFEKTSLTINDYCSQCGQQKSIKHITSNSKNENLASTISKSKDYFGITHDFRGQENCDFCSELNSEEKRLLNCSLSKILKNKSLIQKYSFHIDSEQYNQLLKEYLENPKIEYSDSGPLIHEKKLPIDNRIDLNKTVRYIDNDHTFNFSECGKYIFFKSELYVYRGHNCIEMSDLDLTLKSNLKKFKKVIFAGHDTGFKDDLRRKIFTGDVIQLNSNQNSSKRNPYNCYNKKLEFSNPFDARTALSGAVTHHYTLEDYCIPFDMSAAFLCHASAIQIIGNVFYSINSTNRIDVNNLAHDYFMRSENMSIDPEMFFKTVKTPSFKRPRAIQSLLNLFNYTSKKR